MSYTLTIRPIVIHASPCSATEIGCGMSKSLCTGRNSSEGVVTIERFKTLASDAKWGDKRCARCVAKLAQPVCIHCKKPTKAMDQGQGQGQSCHRKCRVRPA